MSYLLDTCSISEFVARKPNPTVIEKLVQLPRAEVHLCAITIGELEQGIVEMEECDRKAFLQKWLEDHVLPLYFERTFPIDVVVAREWGQLNANLKQRGQIMPIKDSLIAATA